MHHLTQNQVKALLAAIPDLRDRTALLVAYLHGLRITEVCGGHNRWKRTDGSWKEAVYPGIRVKDVKSGHLDVRRLKGSQHTIQPLLGGADSILDERTALVAIIQENQLRPNDRLFNHGRKHYNRLMLKYGPIAGLPAHLCTPHKLKHAIAYHLIKRTGIENVQKYLGHTNMSSTGEYLKVTDAEASSAALAAIQSD